MRRIEVKQIAEFLSSYENKKLLSELTGVKLLYSLFKNNQILEKEIEAINAALPKPSEEWENFIVEMKKEYSDAFSRNEIDDNASLDDYIKEKIKGNEEYKDILKNREDALIPYNEFLLEESDVEFVKISLEDLPENINFEQMKLIHFMID